MHRSVIMTCRYRNDPPEVVGANQTVEEVLESLGIQLRGNTAEQPVDDEFSDIIREESEGKTKKAKVIEFKCLNVVN